MEEKKHRNGVRHRAATKHTATALRRKGLTHREIARKLRISLGSASVWTKGIRLTSRQKREVLARQSAKRWTRKYRTQQARWAKVHLAEYREKYSPDMLLRMIRTFHRKFGRIPLKREFSMSRTFRRQFRSWNNAIREAGFTPNPVLFAKRFIAKDGHVCDSFTERLIDDWLSDHTISHGRGYRYGSTRMTADFFIEPDVIVEFFGLAGVQPQYDVLIKRKKRHCAKQGLQLIGLYPSDLYPKNHLQEKLGVSTSCLRREEDMSEPFSNSVIRTFGYSRSWDAAFMQEVQSSTRRPSTRAN